MGRGGCLNEVRLGKPDLRASRTYGILTGGAGG